MKKLYDRAVSFSEEKLDSIQYVAGYISNQSSRIGFSKGKTLSYRLHGYFQDLSGNYEEAIRYYLLALRAAREGGDIDYEISALSDLAILYTEIKQPLKAKELYLQCLALTEKRGTIKGLISGYSNIGAIYNMLKMPDSALKYLNTSLQLSMRYKHLETIPFIYNNTGNVYFNKKDYGKALEYFRMNRSLHNAGGNMADLWVDDLNIGDCFIELRQFDSAKYYCKAALHLSGILKSKSKEADSYALMSKLYERLGQFREAFEFQKNWYQLDTGLVNASSGRIIAELQEKYHASEREKQNQVLFAEVGKAKLRNRYLTYLSVAAVIIGGLVGISLLVYRRANRKLKEVNLEISKQKEKLATLNQEKNSLLSIVSHDLSTPFASIAMWGNLLYEEKDISDNQRKALRMIRDSANTGERLIRKILEIEKQGTSLHKIDLEETDVAAFLTHLVSEQEARAKDKQIQLIPPERKEGVFLLTDQDLFRRIFENLLSNALKFSPPGKRVWVSVEESGNLVSLEVRDEGVGIPEEEQNRLFSKYGQLSSKPTGGEGSTGLGLSIVKRLVNELNGTIHFTSQEGEGTTFIVQFEK